MSTDRRQLRSQLRSARRQLSAQQQALAGARLRTRLGRNPWFRSAGHIGFYWPNDGEINPLALIDVARRLGKAVYLPVLREDKRLRFRRYRPGDRLHSNRYGIPEPPPLRREVDAAALDLLLLPLVGFDRYGNRLGMGGGFYDRTLAKLRHRRPVRVGLAHALQELARIDSANWDIPLHAIATDREFRLLRRETTKTTAVQSPLLVEDRQGAPSLRTQKLP